MSKEELMEEEYEQENVIELEDEDGNVEKFLHIATLEYKGNWYCYFQKAEPETEEEGGRSKAPLIILGVVALFLIGGTILFGGGRKKGKYSR